MTVRQLQQEMLSDEFTYWREFYYLNPFDGRRDDLHTGILAAAVFNSQGIKAKPAEFIPQFGPEKTQRLNSKQLSDKIKSLLSRSPRPPKRPGSTNGSNRTSRNRSSGQER